jgi:tetratricopeptide (TPR) repeat protein
MTKRDDFELPGRESGGDRPGRALLRVTAAVLVIALAILVLQVVGMLGGHGGRRGGLSTDRIEALALKLERQGLAGPAARAWSDYLEASGAGPEKSARIWYRIGTIHQEAWGYEDALDAYYRSESFAPVDELEPEISRRVAECLESLGRFAALSDELERRTAVPGSGASGGEVLAEIGDLKITKGDLDAMIESEVDAQLSQVAGGFTAEERKAQKQALIESIRKQGGYGQWLERFVAEELLYRGAIEQKLHEEREYRAISRSVERKLLAQRLLDRAVAAEVTVTPEEMKAYYDANQGEFEKDGTAEPFEEVQDRIYVAVRSQKEREVQRRLLDELREKYDVVIHTSKLDSE